MNLESLNLLTREKLNEEYGEDGYWTVSPTQLTVWFRCHYKWFLSYRRGFTAGSNIYMDKGSIAHELQMEFYKFFVEEGHGVRPMSNGELLKIKSDVELQYKEYDKLIMFIRAYNTFVSYARWASTKDDFIPLAVELEVFAPTGKIKDGKPVFLHGFIDLIAMRNGRLGIVDHKTYSSERGKWTAAMVNFDQQLHFYMLMLHLVGAPVEWGCINGLNSFEYKNMPSDDKLFNREFTDKSTEQLMNYQEEIFNLIDEMFDAKAYPKSLLKNCEKCGYQEVCDMELRGMDSETYLELRHSRTSEIVDIAAGTTVNLDELLDDELFQIPEY